MNNQSPDGFYFENYQGRRPMITKKLLVAGALLLSFAGAALAQSQRNYGPAGPATGDTFGEPYSGSAAARAGDWLPYSAYTYQKYWGHRRLHDQFRYR
jgi:hypothetical protein